jgi:hypothetical protein
MGGAVTSMKVISYNKLNYFFYYCERVGLDTYTPELRFYAVDQPYYRLVAVIYNIVDKRTFYEEG